MPLKIETFNNTVGGNAFYKAITHPLAADSVRELLDALKSNGPVAIYDPHGFTMAFDALYSLAGIELAGLFVQPSSSTHSAQYPSGSLCNLKW